MKDIVIIANFCRDFSEKDNGRFMYLCKKLSKAHQVEIITSDFEHLTKKHKGPLDIKWPFKITFLHEPGYKKNISIQRFVSHFFWGRKVGKYLQSRKKPDVIYCAIPSLTAPVKAAHYCKENNIKFVIDIQDLWPEAFKMVFNVPILSNVIFFPFNCIANMIYRRADIICGVSETYVNRALIVNKNDNSHVVFLGTDLKTFDNNCEKNIIQKKSDEIWLCYCGSLNASYDLTVVFDALSIIKQKNIKIPRFVILGTGEKEDIFKEYAKNKGLNCIFTGKLPYDQMCGWLAACDIAVNPISHNAAQSIINKHGDYASAGLPVLNTQENSEYRNLILKYNMGFNCNNGDSEDLALNMIKLLCDSKLRARMADGARKCAEEKFDRRYTYREIINAIMEL